MKNRLIAFSYLGISLFLLIPALYRGWVAVTWSVSFLDALITERPIVLMSVGFIMAQVTMSLILGGFAYHFYLEGREKLKHFQSRKGSSAVAPAWQKISCIVMNYLIFGLGLVSWFAMLMRD